MTAPADDAPSVPDPEVARWLERSEALALSELYGTAHDLPGDPVGARVEAVGSGYAAALVSLDMGFFDRTVGIGIDEPATEAHIAAASAFFAAHDRTQSVIQLAPQVLTDDVERWLEARGYRPGRRWVKLWHPLDDVPSVESAIRIERIGADRAGTFAEIILAAFGMPPQPAALASCVVGRPGWSHYLGFDGETPVSAGAMLIVDGVAWLGFGATVESARGRGGQSSMFAVRLRDAREQGCRLAVTETGEETEDDPVNPSYRNMLRAGFRLGYARRNWNRILS